MLTGVNHITLAVSDLECSLKFYVETLGMKAHVKWQSGAYLSLGNMWFCLSLDKPCPKDDYTHIAFDIAAADFAAFSSRLKSHNVELWRKNKSEGQSIYLLDPDGHKLEVHVGSLASRLESLQKTPYPGLVWLNAK